MDNKQDDISSLLQEMESHRLNQEELSQKPEEWKSQNQPQEKGKKYYSWILGLLLFLFLFGYPYLSAPPKPIINQDRDHEAGERLVKEINGVEFAFRYCPSGSFSMGTPSSETKRWERDEEVRVHRVTLSQGFWMLETEITQKQWQAVMDYNPSYFKGDDLPVDYVSWHECMEFCEKCTELGLPVQLPTEAQWEYACRAGTRGKFAGNLNKMAWYNSNSGSKTPNWFQRKWADWFSFNNPDAQIHPVGTKKPNAWGLYDMHGNVGEWCHDFYGPYPTERVIDPTGPSNSYRIVSTNKAVQNIWHGRNAGHVYRGGSCFDTAWFCRSSYRCGNDSGEKGRGFRIVMGQ